MMNGQSVIITKKIMHVGSKDEIKSNISLCHLPLKLNALIHRLIRRRACSLLPCKGLMHLKQTVVLSFTDHIGSRADKIRLVWISPRSVFICWTAMRSTVSLSSLRDMALQVGTNEASSSMKLFILSLRLFSIWLWASLWKTKSTQYTKCYNRE